MRALRLEKMQREQTKGQIQRLCQTDLAHVFVETGVGKARAGASFASRSNLHKRWANVRLGSILTCV
jgi:hypothetical protein